MSEHKEYGEYEQVNGAMLNDANKRIAELEAELLSCRESIANWSEQYGKQGRELDALREKLEAIENQEQAELQPLETVKYWADVHTKDPYTTGGGMTSKLLQEYAYVRAKAGTKLYTKPTLSELSDGEIESIIGDYFDPIEYIHSDEVKLITLFVRAILTKARGD